MGRAAAHLLLARLGHEGGEVVHRFDPELIVRQSVARNARRTDPGDPLG
jgi:DNA-binding LacI/PurR family transcriptional regulator